MANGGVVERRGAFLIQNCENSSRKIFKLSE
jgi:hypothetical protein